MRTPRVLVCCAALLALATALSVFAGPAAAAAPASVPTWQAGQSVGYGTHLDLGALVDPYLKVIRADPSLLNITTINALNVTGSLDVWEVDTVTQATSAYYTLGMQSADGIKLHVEANLTFNNLPVAGTYAGTVTAGGCLPPASVPTGPGTLAVMLDATSLTTVSGERRLQTSNLAYINETDNPTAQTRISFAGYHIPFPSIDNTTCAETIAYKSPTFVLTANTQDQARVYYGAWDYFNFPISDNKTWWANTTATVGATLAGTVNVQGLSSQDEQAFFDNVSKAFESAHLTVSGLSSFPIDLSKVSILAGPSYIVNNGVVTDYPVPLNANYRAIASVLTLSDGSQHPVYLITNASYECPAPAGTLIPPIGWAAVYAPDFPAAGAGMIVGYQLLVCGSNINLPGFALTNTKPSDAQQNIGQTETTYTLTPPTPSNGILDFFTQAPYWGVLILVVAVAAVAVVLLLRRRRKPAAAPPAPTPPPPGPPSTP